MIYIHIIVLQDLILYKRVQHTQKKTTNKQCLEIMNIYFILNIW